MKTNSNLSGAFYVGTKVRILPAYQMVTGKRDQIDSFTGLEGEVVEIDGDDVLVDGRQLAYFAGVWVNVGRVARVSVASFRIQAMQ
jgi:hypothetical protein